MKGDLVRQPRYFGFAGFVAVIVVLILVFTVFLVGRELLLESEHIAREMEQSCLKYLEGPDASYPAFDMCQKQEKRNNPEKTRGGE